MAKVTFAEYESAKDEIIHGKEYRVKSVMTDNVTRKNYAVNDGTFYEVSTLRDDGSLKTEFWSTKHPEIRLYIQEAYQPVFANMGRILGDNVNRRILATCGVIDAAWEDALKGMEIAERLQMPAQVVAFDAKIKELATKRASYRAMIEDVTGLNWQRYEPMIRKIRKEEDQ
ncbi:hypothetical protein FACS1894184_08510 [Clostridia bacterium]|nr:hypothetical protein FACS1894184_08510 [Clostridia bacterium]